MILRETVKNVTVFIFYISENVNIFKEQIAKQTLSNFERVSITLYFVLQTIHLFSSYQKDFSLRFSRHLLLALLVLVWF